MGPLSSQAKEFFPECHCFPNIRGGKAHSIILQADVSADALFLSYISEEGKGQDPEIYPRPDGTVYVCGQGNNDVLPEDPKDIVQNMEACRMLRKITSELSSILEMRVC